MASGNNRQTGSSMIDIPVNFQGGYIETDELEGYNPAEDDASFRHR